MAVVLWNVDLQRRHMTDLVRGSAERTAETIQRALHDAMLRSGADEVNEIVDRIVSQQDVERIRLFDLDGRITASSDRTEVDTLVDQTAEACSVCHGVDPPRQSLDPRFRVRQFESADGTRLLAVTSPFRNEERCGKCHNHPRDRKVLGVLDVHLSMEPVEASLLASERQLGAGIAVAIVCVALLAGALVWWMVIRPVRALTAATVSAGHGDLGTRVEVTSTCELGSLGNRWNETMDELDRSRERLAEWSHMLEQRVAEKTRELEKAHENMVVVEKMVSLGKLAATVAHEINNPLAGISTYARLLRKGLSPDAKGQRALTMMEEEARRCGRIVRNLLLFSRDQGANLEEINLGELVDRDVMLVQHGADLGAVEIRIEIEEGLPPLYADRGQIQQLLLVLFMNAIEAMPDGGLLSLRAERGGEDEVVLTVSDTGCGIPPEQQSQVFEPFFTTKEEGKGVGLGLAVAYGIVERHGGRIQLDSVPGQGTTFTVYLPRMRAPVPAQEGTA
ncbi:MAG: sensor histidine kinase [Planctomycetota bacterium]